MWVSVATFFAYIGFTFPTSQAPGNIPVSNTKLKSLTYNNIIIFIDDLTYSLTTVPAICYIKFVLQPR